MLGFIHRAMAKTNILDIYGQYYAPESEVAHTPKLGVLSFVVLLTLDPTACPYDIGMKGRELKRYLKRANVQSDEFVDEFINYCSCLRKGKYLQWIIAHRKEISVDHISEESDNSDLLTEALTWYDYNKPYLVEKQINKLNVEELFLLYRENKGADLKLLHEMGKAKAKGAEMVYMDDDWALVVPNTFEASCYYGQFTKWCTTERKDPSYFYDYSEKGPLYILIDRHSHHKYQLYFVKGEYDFRDEIDYSVYPWDIPMSDGVRNYLLEASGSKGYTTEAMNRMLREGVAPEDIFDKVNAAHDGFRMVKIDMRYNYLNVSTNQLVGNTWYFFAKDYVEGKALVWIMRYSTNLLDVNNHLLSEKWMENNDAWEHPDYYDEESPDCKDGEMPF